MLKGFSHSHRCIIDDTCSDQGGTIHIREERVLPELQLPPQKVTAARFSADPFNLFRIFQGF